MGSSSAVVRLLISGGGAAKSFRSNRIPTYLFTAKRMIISTTTSGGVSSFVSAPSPWLMMNPYYYRSGMSIFKFYSLATDEICNVYTAEYRERNGEDWEILGSSNGWLGLYNPNDHGVWLFDPFTDRVEKLPSMGSVVHALITVENTRRAVAAAGSGGHLAFCSPFSSSVWTSFPSDKACGSLSYSSRHSRLFCVTRDAANNKSSLEIWNLGERDGDTPKREWEMALNVEYRSRNNNNLKKLMYVACAEHSGEVFLVVRHVRIQRGYGGSFVGGIVSTDYVGNKWIDDPYKTDNFKVYKVDLEGRRLIQMKGSLGGLSIFVGTNQPLAIPATEVAGVKPDSVYFTYDRRIRQNVSDGEYKYGREDNGIYDYLKMKFSPVYTYDRDHAPLKPLWFTSS